MAKNNYGNVFWGFMIAGVTVFIGAGWFWWKEVYTKPQNVFWGMIDNSLSSRGITRKVSQEGEGSNFSQTTQLIFINKAAVLGRTDLLQQAADGEDKVVTETIGTAQSDYLRYTSISTGQKKATGENFDFSSLLGVWGKQDASQVDSSTGRFFQEAALGVIPFANLTPKSRQELVSMMRVSGAYRVDFSKAVRKSENGRSVVVFPAEVNLVEYTKVLQALVKALGLNEVAELNPDDYKGVPAVKLEVSVDVLSRNLRSITYSDNQRVESYGGHGLIKDVKEPRASVGFEELQTRLQNVQ